MSETKPFDISKRLVWEAYQRVRANKGAAGVDGQSIDEFEQESDEQSLPTLESTVVGELLPAGGSSGTDSEEVGRGTNARCTHRYRSYRADGGHTGVGAAIGSSLS
jgi:hypothetical protein